MTPRDRVIALWPPGPGAAGVELAPDLELSVDVGPGALIGAAESISSCSGVVYAAASLDFPTDDDPIVRARAIVAPGGADATDVLDGLLHVLPAATVWTLVVEQLTTAARRTFAHRDAPRGSQSRMRRGFQCRRRADELVLRAVLHGLWAGRRVSVEHLDGEVPAGLEPGREYYAMPVTPDDFALASSLEDAMLGRAVALLGPGSGSRLLVG